MTNTSKPCHASTYNEQLAEIIYELQAAHKEFEELEAKLKERELQNEPNH